MFPGTYFKSFMYFWIFPQQFIGYILTFAQHGKIGVPVRKAVTFAAVDASGGRSQIPKFIVSHIGPGHKMVNGYIFFIQQVFSIDFMYRSYGNDHFPVLFYFFQIALSWRIELFHNSRNAGISSLKILDYI